MAKLVVRVVAALAVLLCAASVSAQTCMPTPYNYISQWSTEASPEVLPAQIAANYNPRHVFGPAIPAGQVMLLREVGISTNDGRSWPYMLELLEVQPDSTYIYHSIMSPQVSYSTPAAGVMAPSRFVVLSGERLAARVNADTSFAGFRLMFSGFLFPDTCLPVLLGVQTATVTASGTTNPPGTSPLNTNAVLAAAQRLIDAGNALTASIP